MRLVGFGTFSVRERAAGKGRNPATGKEIKIPASKNARFKAGRRAQGRASTRPSRRRNSPRPPGGVAVWPATPRGIPRDEGRSRRPPFFRRDCEA